MADSSASLPWSWRVATHSGQTKGADGWGDLLGSGWPSQLGAKRNDGDPPSTVAKPFWTFRDPEPGAERQSGSTGQGSRCPAGRPAPSGRGWRSCPGPGSASTSGGWWGRQRIEGWQPAGEGQPLVKVSRVPWSPQQLLRPITKYYFAEPTTLPLKRPRKESPTFWLFLKNEAAFPKNIDTSWLGRIFSLLLWQSFHPLCQVCQCVCSLPGAEPHTGSRRWRLRRQGLLGPAAERWCRGRPADPGPPAAAAPGPTWSSHLTGSGGGQLQNTGKFRFLNACSSSDWMSLLYIPEEKKVTQGFGQCSFILKGSTPGTDQKCR